MAKIDAKHREKLKKNTNRNLNSNPEWKIPTRIANFLFKQRFLTQLTKTVGEKITPNNHKNYQIVSTDLKGCSVYRYFYRTLCLVRDSVRLPSIHF